MNGEGEFVEAHPLEEVLRCHESFEPGCYECLHRLERAFEVLFGETLFEGETA